MLYSLSRHPRPLNYPWRTPSINLEPELTFLQRYSRGAFLFSKHTLPLLLSSTSPTYPPTLIFTGATASLKGSALFSSFATGKFALRALTQSLGREFGPKGVHVAHAIVSPLGTGLQTLAGDQ